MTHYEFDVGIEYSLNAPASHARQIVRLLPRSLGPRQVVVESTLEIDPVPDERFDRDDFFGNSAVEVAFHHPFDGLLFRAHGAVTCSPVPGPEDDGASVGQLLEELRRGRSLAPNAPHHFIAPSARVNWDEAIEAYARERADDAGSVLEFVRSLCDSLHADIDFDSGATDVDTAPTDAFARRHGVCQDFAHIGIACLRSVGVPALYVSGLLRTVPPPGQERLRGADAMHAWVSAYLGPSLGWVEVDPTIGRLVSDDHVVIGYGRDYGDVAPVRGTLRTAGGQRSAQRVDLVPVEAPPAPGAEAEPEDGSEPKGAAESPPDVSVDE